MTDLPASTRSIYIGDDLWERLEPLAVRLTNGSKSQLIENILKDQIGKIERTVENAEANGILLVSCTS